MSYLIGFLTVVMVLDCLLLILLVLVQLPKKEAGAGVAFGGGATDALFGAGSGNALTKITKYATGIFFALAIIISMLQARLRNSEASLNLGEGWQNAPRPAASAPATTPAPEPASAPAAAPVNTDANTLMSIPATATTNSAPATQ